MATASSSRHRGSKVQAMKKQEEDNEEEGGIACLEGPDGMRVILIEQNLLGFDARRTNFDAVESSVSSRKLGLKRTPQSKVASQESISPQEAPREHRARGQSPSLSQGLSTEFNGGPNRTFAASPHERVLGARPLLQSLAVLAERRSSVSHSPSAPAGSSNRALRASSAETQDVRRGEGRDSKENAAKQGGVWFSEEDLRREHSHSLVRGTPHPVDPRQTKETSQASPVDEKSPQNAALSVVPSSSGGLNAQASENGTPSAAASTGGVENADPSRVRKKTRLMPVERPFRQLEVFNLGNVQGPLRATPNSLVPIPIDNEYFVGSSMILMRRTPMDKTYAPMFEGKNRMFEVQVQGRFKKAPEGDLYISLEITERMKLGFLTKGLCRALLSFGQRLNKRLHYSFGTDDNSELPHIAFPLVSSVDSLIRTADGEEVPELGKPFKESAESKANRKKMDSSGGFGSYETGRMVKLSSILGSGDISE